MRQLMARFCREDRGQDLIEYVLITSVISIGAILGAQALGGALNGWFSEGKTWVDAQNWPTT